jgi:iron complex outermembrane recepter protein
MKLWQLSANLNLQLVVILSGCWGVAIAQPGLTEEISSIHPTSNYFANTVHKNKNSSVPQLRNIKFPATSAKLLVQQPSPTNPPATGEVIAITGVKANPTDKDVEVILETAQGDKLQVANRSTGNNFIADITGGQLRLPNGDAFMFRSDKPIAGITEIIVTNIDANTVRVMVVGEKALPAVELFDDNAGLIFTVASTAIAAQEPKKPPTEEKPVTEKPEEKPFSQEDNLIELVVTGEQDGYRVPNTSVGTRTDTPLRDIPQAINVVPQQVIQDTQSRSIYDALENVPGVQTQGAGPAFSRTYLTLRGFENYDPLVNGLPDGLIFSDNFFFNVDRLEVLKGPASVLYGGGAFGSTGGLVNYVTRRPLNEPFFEVEATAGNYNFYEGKLDVSSPLNASRSALGRFILGYRSEDTFVDFSSSRYIGFAPSLSIQLGSKTNLILEGDLTIREGDEPSVLPVIGTLLPNPNGKVRNSFNLRGPDIEDYLSYNGRVGYELEHQFNDNLILRNAFRFTFFDSQETFIGVSGLDADNQTLNRNAFVGFQYSNNYIVDTNLLSKFKTGSVAHQLLFGFSLGRNYSVSNSESGIPIAPVNIFNPIYDQTISPTGVPTSSDATTNDALGVYVQDQMTLLPNLKLLLGGRFDGFEQRRTDRLTDTESSQSGNAFTPRVGLVYQPIEPISLYASYSRSFTPVIGRTRSGEFLVPERGTQYEVGIKADLTRRLSASLALYDLTRTNVRTPDPANPEFSVQSGKQRSRGIEFEIGGEILPGLNITAGYAYTDARVLEDNNIPTGNRLFNAPEHAINLWTTYRIQSGAAKGLGFGLGLYYIGERPIDNANTVNLPGFLRTDVAVFYEQDKFRAALNVRNLFDVENYVSNFGSSDFVAAGTPFTIQGSLSWQF